MLLLTPRQLSHRAWEDPTRHSPSSARQIFSMLPWYSTSSSHPRDRAPAGCPSVSRFPISKDTPVVHMTAVQPTAVPGSSRPISASPRPAFRKHCPRAHGELLWRRLWMTVGKRKLSSATSLLAAQAREIATPPASRKSPSTSRVTSLPRRVQFRRWGVQVRFRSTARGRPFRASADDHRGLLSPNPRISVPARRRETRNNRLTTRQEK